MANNALTRFLVPKYRILVIPHIDNRPSFYYVQRQEILSGRWDYVTKGKAGREFRNLSDCFEAIECTHPIRPYEIVTVKFDMERVV